MIFTKRIGFCFGVKRAIEMAEAALKKNKPIYSLGSVIHNSQVVGDLARKGLKVIKDIDEVRGGTVVVSSHGTSPRIAKRITDSGARIIDTTCPFVLNAQRIAGSLSDKGYTVIIVGDRKHPEVKALVDFVKGRVLVVKGYEEIKRLKLKSGEKIGVISQTTQSTANFLKVVKAVLEKKPKAIRVVNTICKDAEERQAAARDLARSVDLMVVIGGKQSANTKRLYEVCRSVLKNSHLIEKEGDLKSSWFKDVKKIGVASGASTPGWIIEKVVKKIEK